MNKIKVHGKTVSSILPNEFIKQILNYSEQMRLESQNIAFAFILYDIRNEHIIKILNDIVFANVIDGISDKYLLVYSREIELKALKTFVIPKNETGIKYNLLRFISTTMPMKDFNKQIADFFNFERSLKLPCIIFFQVHNENINGAFAINLKEETEEKSFKEIKMYLETVTNALKNILPEHYNNHVEIYNIIERHIGSKETIVKIKAGFGIAKKIKDFVGIFSS